MAARQLPLKETWRRPSGHAILFGEKGAKWLLFGSPTPNVRVPANLKDVLDLDKYEAFTCLNANSSSENGGTWAWPARCSSMEVAKALAGPWIRRPNGKW